MLYLQPGLSVRIVEMVHPDLALLAEADPPPGSDWKMLRGIYQLKADGGVYEIAAAVAAAPRANDYIDSPYYKGAGE